MEGSDKNILSNYKNAKHFSVQFILAAVYD